MIRDLRNLLVLFGLVALAPLLLMLAGNAFGVLDFIFGAVAALHLTDSLTASLANGIEQAMFVVD